MFRVAFSGTERAVTRNLCFNRGNRDPAMSLAHIVRDAEVMIVAASLGS